MPCARVSTGGETRAGERRTPERVDATKAGAATAPAKLVGSEGWSRRRARSVRPEGQAPRDFKIRSITSSWCGKVRAEIIFISSPHELHKLGFSNHTLAINLAQFLRLTLANWLSSSSMTTTSLGACGVSSFFIHPSSRRIVVEIAPYEWIRHSNLKAM